MHFSALFAVLQTGVAMPAGNAAEEIVLRWIHFIAGITWIGLLYFFNLVNVPFLRELGPDLRPRVLPGLMSRAMWWFRWASVVTVVVGLRYWSIIVLADAHNAGVSPGRPFWSFFLVWTAAFILYMGLLMGPADALRRGPVLTIITVIIIVGASYIFLAINSGEWQSNRQLCIGIGGGLGWFMLLNVWGVVWRVQKRMIQWSEAAANGTPMPPQAAKLATQSLLSTRTNFVLSFPLLFFMGAASHYPIFIR